MQRVAAVIAAVGWLIVASPLYDTLSLESYWQRIREVRAAVEQAQNTGDAAPLREYADILEGITAVELPDGTRVEVSHSYLVGLLRAEPPPYTHLLATLDLMLRNNQREGPVNALPSQEVLAEERTNILSRAEFQYRPTPFWDAVSTVFDEVLAFFTRFSNPIGLSARFVLSLLGLVIVMVAATFALRHILEGAVREAQYRPELDEMESLTSETALDRARETSEGGDYRSAVRYLYLSTLLLLEERGLLRYDRTRTNLEYIRSLRERPEMAAIFADVVDVFDRVWYGFQTIDADTYESYAQRVSDLQRQR